MIKNLPAMLETWVWSLGREDTLEKGMVTHSSWQRRTLDSLSNLFRIKVDNWWAVMTPSQAAWLQRPNSWLCCIAHWMYIHQWDPLLFLESYRTEGLTLFLHAKCSNTVILYPSLSRFPQATKPSTHQALHLQGLTTSLLLRASPSRSSFVFLCRIVAHGILWWPSLPGVSQLFDSPLSPS